MRDAASEVYGLGERAVARKSDPDTSHDAAASISEEALTASQDYVLYVFKLYAGRGLSDITLNRECYEFSESRIRTARCELVRKGLVRDSGRRERTPSGRQAVVWELVPR